MAFTGLRGFAALWVVAYHFRDGLGDYISPLAMTALGQGFLAVDVFFILSGFIIYLKYRWLLDDFNLRSARTFIGARFARIYPVHLVVSLLCLLSPIGILLFSQARDLGARYDASYYVLNLLLIHNWGLTDSVAWNIPSWSISTEWFAYLMFPVILCCIGRNRLKPPFIIAEILGGLVLLALVCLFAGVSSIGDDIPHLGLIRCFLEFVIGTGLCRLYLLAKTQNLTTSYGLLGLALMLIVVTIRFDLADYILIPAACALLILSLTNDAAFLSRLLACRPLVGLGEVSYSVYMIHYLVKDWIKFLNVESFIPEPYLFFMYLVLTLGAGLAVYALVEKPGRQIFRSLALKKA